MKIVVIGLSKSGKSTFANLLEPKENEFEANDFRNFRYTVTEKTTFDIWDLNGALPHLWTHHCQAVDGFIFCID